MQCQNLTVYLKEIDDFKVSNNTKQKVVSNYKVEILKDDYICDFNQKHFSLIRHLECLSFFTTNIYSKLSTLQVLRLLLISFPNTEIEKTIH